MKKENYFISYTTEKPAAPDMEKPTLNGKRIGGLALFGVGLLALPFSVIACIRNLNEWHLVWIVCGIFSAAAIICTGYLTVLPALGLRATTQSNKDSWEHKQQTKLVDYHKKGKLYKIMEALESYNEDDLEKIRRYIESEKEITPNAMLPIVSNTTLGGTIASAGGVIASAKFDSTTWLIFSGILCVEFVAIAGLTFFQNRRQKAYKYILEAIPSIKRNSHGSDEPAPTSAPEKGGAAKHNLPSRNRYFTGRADMLAQIHAGFQKSSVVTVTGAGGFGKTQAAVEYAYAHASEYELMWLFNAESEATLEADCREFAIENLGVRETTGIDFPAIMRMFSDWVKENPSCLLIYDNAEGCPRLREYLPTSLGRSHILINSREKLRGIVAEPLEADVFSPPDSVEFIRRRVGNADPADAEALAEALGRLPLALECAAAYIEENKYNISEYLKLYERHGLKVLSGHPAATSYDKTVLTVWSATFEKISQEAESDEETKAALQLFNLCAYCAADDIPLRLFIDGRDGAPALLKEFLDPKDAPGHDALIGKLTRYSLVSLNRVGERARLTVHRLIQTAVKQGFGRNAEWVSRCLKIACSGFKYRYGTREELEEFSASLPHVAEIARQAEGVLTDDDSQGKIACVYEEAEEGLYHRGDYVGALELCRKVLAIREKTSGAEHLDTAGAYNNIALMYRAQGDYKNALELYSKALEIYEKTLGAEHPRTAVAYNNIANVYHAQGGYENALEWHRKALAIREKTLGAEHLDTADTYNNIAGVYRAQGEYENALELCHKALAIREEKLGAEHLDTADTYNNIASVYHDQGKYENALEHYRKVLKVIEKTLGAEYPHTAGGYNNIALVYRDQGKYENALELLCKALAIREKTLGAEHLDTADTYNNIAIVYRDQEKYENALEYYSKALAIIEKTLGEEHPRTAVAYNNIANVYHAQGGYENALEWHRKALAIREKKLGAEHPNTAVTYYNIATVYHAQGRYREALDLFSLAMNIFMIKGLEEHPYAKEWFSAMRACYEEAGGDEKDFDSWWEERLKTYPTWCA